MQTSIMKIARNIAKRHQTYSQIFIQWTVYTTQQISISENTSKPLVGSILNDQVTIHRVHHVTPLPHNENTSAVCDESWYGRLLPYELLILELPCPLVVLSSTFPHRSAKRHSSTHGLTLRPLSISNCTTATFHCNRFIINHRFCFLFSFYFLSYFPLLSRCVKFEFPLRGNECTSYTLSYLIWLQYCQSKWPVQMHHSHVNCFIC